jgi:hypothetical protein
MLALTVGEEDRDRRYAIGPDGRRYLPKLRTFQAEQGRVVALATR